MANSTPTQTQTSKAAQWLAHELGLHTMRHAGKDVYILILTRYLRMYAYGTVALILALYLRAQGLSDAQIGFFMTLTLLGDVVVSLLLTLVADALGRRRTLMLGALGMAVSGGVFALDSRYEVLLLAAVVGVISPSGNEIGPFRAVEESTLAQLVGEEGRADVFTWYVAFAVIGTSTGLIVGGQAVDALSARPGWTDLDAYRAVFWVYTAVGLVKAICTLFLSQECEHQKHSKSTPGQEETEPLLPAADDDAHQIATSNGATHSTESKEKKWNPFTSISPQSRMILFQLCSLFFLDSLGSGMVPFSLINYYLDRKFSLPKGKLGGIMSATCAHILPYFLTPTVLAAPLAPTLPYQNPSPHAPKLTPQVSLHPRQHLLCLALAPPRPHPSNGLHAPPLLPVPRRSPLRPHPRPNHRPPHRPQHDELDGPGAALGVPEQNRAARRAHCCHGHC
ncbi:hypothetical protein OPT61_g2715 [Boeremia exigua]|uniref:Uncharacterized protein n=1 Tax=Boeremia exigua TaxID=749465 RepID=A0ACC2IKF4_9PLEO|nr:hypothetical protein OPT61_g2715 [Boeremia exigua]